MVSVKLKVETNESSLVLKSFNILTVFQPFGWKFVVGLSFLGFRIKMATSYGATSSVCLLESIFYFSNYCSYGREIQNSFTK